MNETDYTEDEMADNQVLMVNEIIINDEIDFVILQGECPFCRGLFGVDMSYIETVSTVIHCPMCCMEVDFGEADEE